MPVETECKVRVYETNDKEVPVGADEPAIRVRSHWNIEDWVRITVGGKTVTVNSNDLASAIGRCSR